MNPRHFLKRTVLICLITLFGGRLAAQDSLTMFAAGTDFLSSGNGHGGFVRVFGGLERKRNLLVRKPLYEPLEHVSLPIR